MPMRTAVTGYEKPWPAYGCTTEVTHVRNVTGFLAALEQWRFAAILLDYALSSSESSAAFAAAR